MNVLFLYALDQEQLDGLAKFCFDIAKAATISVLLPQLFLPQPAIAVFVDSLRSLAIATSFLYLALLILKVKREVKVG